MSISTKVKMCYLNFIFLFVVGVVVYASGFILWLISPRGQIHSRSQTENIFLGLGRGFWGYTHNFKSSTPNINIYTPST